MFLERRLLKNLDFYMLAAIISIVGTGILMIYSATHANYGDNNGDPFFFVKRQVLWFIIGAVAMFFTISIDYRNFSKYAGKIYIFNLIILASVLVIGKTSLGAQRWIDIGPFAFQPSEFAKIFIIITLATTLEDRIGELNTLRDLLPILIHIAIPMVLIMKQPDLGTSLVFIAIFFGMVLVAGISWKILAGVITTGICLLPVFWHFLKDYQKKRIMVFLDPNVDPTGSGYHIIQSKIAIGSGGLWGQGLFSGTQSQLNFLPEHHTDFIFAVLAEELGFVGVLFLLGLYFIVIWRGMLIASEAKDNYGTLLAVGIVSMLLFHLLVNIGMNSGIMPVTGLPLFFMSYGGSSMLTNMIALGILINVGMRRQKILF